MRMKTYDLVPSKREVQKRAIVPVRPKIIGLAGPNADKYIKVLKNIGFSQIELYENDFDVYLKHKKHGVLFDDILNNLGKDAFYDYDFCCTIKKIERWLPQIVRTPNYSLTLAVRGVGYTETIKTFKKYGNANYMTYMDTSPMITFFNHKN